MIVLVSSYELLDTYTLICGLHMQYHAVVIWWHLYYSDRKHHLAMQTRKTIRLLFSKAKHYNMHIVVETLKDSISLEDKRKHR